MKELGIYIHIPFCKKKCYYCDFTSFSNKNNCIEDYINVLLKEIEVKNKVKDHEVTTIYIGGGTPSIVNEEYIEKILKCIYKNYKVSKNAEITIEVNPGTCNKEKIKKYKEIGINRLSIGLQTTDNTLLKTIGRIHTYEEFVEIYNLAKENGIENINVDLMLALPNQTIEMLEDSVNKVINLNPNHISVYSLILEEETKLEQMLDKGILQLPNEDIERQMYWKVKEILENNGYKHYEISNFAKVGYESKHNTNCWEQKEYLGMGLSAHSYFNNIRFCNIDNLDEYIKNGKKNYFEQNIITCEKQNTKEKQKEYMMLGLRKIDGVNIQEFKNIFIDNPLYMFHKELEKLVNKELIEVDLNNIKLTKKGIDFANLVWQEFV